MEESHCSLRATECARTTVHEILESANRRLSVLTCSCLCSCKCHSNLFVNESRQLGLCQVNASSHDLHSKSNVSERAFANSAMIEESKHTSVLKQ
ncbi:hypothetical protein HanRHA438_Chr10g0437511 [Helianthus annuus]|nr:hypothetical protein HanRHA438_Chr10g0437511 [Helianthus annuus]